MTSNLKVKKNVFCHYLDNKKNNNNATLVSFQHAQYKTISKKKPGVFKFSMSSHI